VAGAVGGQGVGGEGALLGEVFGVEDDLAVGARGDGCERGEVDGCGHDESLGVVGVFADEVDAAWGGKDLRRRVVAALVQDAECGGIFHVSSSGMVP